MNTLDSTAQYYECPTCRDYRERCEATTNPVVKHRIYQEWVRHMLDHQLYTIKGAEL